MNRFAAVMAADQRSLVRDPMLLFTVFLPVAIILGAHFALPPLVSAFPGFFARHPVEPYVIAALVSLTAILYGWVIGFMLLDDRDERVLVAVRVSPVSDVGYLVRRLTWPVFASAVVGVFALVYLAPDTLVGALPILVIGLLEAPLFALALVALAKNKVEGMAVGKFISQTNWGPLSIFFVPEPWQWLFGVFPPYWVGKPSLVVVEGGDPWRFILAGVIYHLVLIGLLGRRFLQQAD